MYLRITKSGPRRYVQLVEAYRDEQGRPRQKTLATLGRYEKVIAEADALINSLGKLLGRTEGNAPEDLRVAFDTARSLGDIHVLQSLWQQLGFDLLRRVFRSSSRTTDVEQLLRIMVFNRLCNPASKLGVLRWLETVAFPEDTSHITHQHLLRAMDVLVQKQDRIEEVLAGQIRPLLDDALSVVFYDLTTVTAEGDSEQEGDLRRYGRSKSGGLARQVVIGLIQTADGIPLAHEVFEGNVSEASTLQPMLTRVCERYPVQRVVVVADRGLLNLENLKALEGVRLPSGQPLEYILAVPASRYGDMEDVITPLHDQHGEGTPDWTDETCWQDRRLVVDHREDMALQQRAARQTQLDELRALARGLFDRLDMQEAGAPVRGRRLSETAAIARLHAAVKAAGMSHLMEVDLDSGELGYLLRAPRQRALERLDGKLMLVTNVRDLPAEDIVSRYRALADIERGFRVLKSELEIGPMYHRLPQRIRAHALICFLALVLHRVMRMRMRAAGSDTSPERCLDMLTRIQKHRITVNGKLLTGVTTLDATQLELLKSLKVPKPAA